MKKLEPLDKRFCAPDGWRFDDFKNVDGKSVRFGHAKPNGEVKGTVVMTTGYADFIESYFETIHDYLDRGYEVWMMDWAGQGGSERYVADKPWIPNPKGIDANIRDLRQFRQKIVTAASDKPVVLNTHSMGGHVAMHYLRRYHGDFDMAVLAAPFIGVRLGKTKRRLARFMTDVMVGFGFGNRKVKGRDRVVERIKAVRERLIKQDPVRSRLHRYYAKKNPDLKVGNPTYGWLSNSFKNVARLNNKEYLKGIKTPVLVLGAEKDGIVDNVVTRAAVMSLPRGRYVGIKEATHGMWTERTFIREEMWDYIDQFLKQGGHPSVYRAYHAAVKKDAGPDHKPSPKP